MAAESETGQVGEEQDRAHRALTLHRGTYYEQPREALGEAVRCQELGRLRDDPLLRARALILEAVVAVHRGDLASATGLALEAEGLLGGATGDGSLMARCELSALKGQLSFFTGSYSEALAQAEQALNLADASDDTDLRIYTRRATCPVFGNIGVPNWHDRLLELLALTVASGSAWEEAISRNDLACFLSQEGEHEAAARQLAHGLGLFSRYEQPCHFATAVLLSTRADVRLQDGDPAGALEDAERSIALLTMHGEPNPYVLAITVRAAVQARMAVGAFDAAQQFGEGALAWLGERVPRMRGLILSAMAAALREAGRTEEAYQALSQAAELERQAFQELSQLQLRLERATMQAHAARRETDALEAKNRQLSDAHAALEERTRELEGVRDELRELADRDWLTGLHNRRFLARELDRLSATQQEGPFSLAVIDLDHFKDVNDRFGHDSGDRVLIRVAGLLCGVLRDTDMVVRSGGEEFVVLMPHTDVNAAEGCCERIRGAISVEPWHHLQDGLAMTVSAGVASSQVPGDLEALIRVADERLYEAKAAGRDRVVGERA